MKNKFCIGNLVMYTDTRRTNVSPLNGDILLITEVITEELIQVSDNGDKIRLYRVLHNNREYVIPETKMKLCE